MEPMQLDLPAAPAAPRAAARGAAAPPSVGMRAEIGSSRRGARRGLIPCDEAPGGCGPRSLVAGQLMLFIFASLVVSHIRCATATPLPSISVSSSKHQQPDMAAADISGKPIQAGDGTSPLQQDFSGAGAGVGVGVGAGAPLPMVEIKGRTAEKLKRGLTNFMNQLNPAPFFVPTIQPQSSSAGGDLSSAGPKDKQPNSSSAEPATIVTQGDSSLVLKGPANRWAFARPIGGPLRWGRR